MTRQLAVGKDPAQPQNGEYEPGRGAGAGPPLLVNEIADAGGVAVVREDAGDVAAGIAELRPDQRCAARDKPDPENQCDDALDEKRGATGLAKFTFITLVLPGVQGKSLRGHATRIHCDTVNAIGVAPDEFAALRAGGIAGPDLTCEVVVDRDTRLRGVRRPATACSGSLGEFGGSNLLSSHRGTAPAAAGPSPVGPAVSGSSSGQLR